MTAPASSRPGSQAPRRLALTVIWTAFVLAVGVALLLGQALDRQRTAQGETRATSDFMFVFEIDVSSHMGPSGVSTARTAR